MAIYPNVPIAPGVPPLLRNPLAPIVTTALLVADAVLSIIGLFGNQWGIFQNGIPVIVPDTVATVEYKQAWLISDYPVEEGAFQSYDKVQTPFEATIRMAVGGSTADRQVFLEDVAAIAGTFDLYDVVTPDAIYQSANVVSYDYRRTAHEGLGLLVVDIRLVEVRVTATTQFSNTQSPSGANTTFTGAVNPATPTPAQAATASSVQ